MRSGERSEFIEQMFDKLKDVPTEHVVGKYVQLQQRGRHLMGLCPFHNDTHIGSFVVTPGKHMWKCFTCGDNYGGDAVNFVALYKGINYLDAAFQVSLEEGLISQDEYEKFTKKKYERDYIESLKSRHMTKETKPNVPKVNYRVMQDVFQFMHDYSGLSDKHMEHLKEERQLSENRIKTDYFTFPNYKKDRLISALKKAYPQYTDEILRSVPGFYYDIEHEKLTYAGYAGIGILLRDYKGRIRGIQIRKDKVTDKKASRYVWFASTFAWDDPKYLGGNTIGSPKDVCVPNQRTRMIGITEGRFKAEKLAEHGICTVSIQGVSTYRGVERDVAMIKANNDVKNVYIFLDSDILGNVPNFKHAMGLGKTLMKEFPELIVNYAIWPKELGKGIDDLLLNGHKDKIGYFSRKCLIETYDVVLHDLYEKYNVKTFRDVPKELGEQFVDDLQKRAQVMLLGTYKTNQEGKGA